MNITYLIGNGFDLGLGLATRFGDFYKQYLLSVSSNEYVKKFKEEISNNIENWSDFELQLGKYTRKFSNNEADKFISIKQDFENAFIKYLVEEQNKFDVDRDWVNNVFVRSLYWFKGNQSIRQHVLSEITEHLDINGHINFNFINFNYTNTLSRILEKVNNGSLVYHEPEGRDYEGSHDSIGDLHHVHGKIGETPIIGVNDSSQIENEYFAKSPDMTQFLVKQEFDELNERDFTVDAERIIEDSMMICVYGLSLGETDRYWWQLLMEWLNRGFGHQLVFFMYDKNHIETAYSHGAKVKEYKRKIKELCATDFYGEESLWEKVNIVVNTPIFENDKIIVESKTA